MADDFDWNHAALAELAESAELRQHLDIVGKQVRNRARSNAGEISSDLASAIEVEDGQDGDGVFTDVGYLKAHPGFVLWWHEVGTRHYPATPHLRPALKPGS